MEAGAPEPHAVTLSTANSDGPDARVLLLKDVAPEDTCSFATSNESAKGKPGTRHQCHGRRVGRSAEHANPIRGRLPRQDRRGDQPAGGRRR
ncbi:pyridoxamine 5'-phosphate oxidase family protein [Nocardioides sp.]|uniref:pyridoxamine 5'-phosphate oxidase family protein n=1 Tax=Nocardioides sp. TaxID=35761 RepID=UPI0039E4C6F5